MAGARLQLPPALARDDLRLEYFLDRGPEWTQVAVEFRHPGWHVDDVYRKPEQYRPGLPRHESALTSPRSLSRHIPRSGYERIARPGWHALGDRLRRPPSTPTKTSRWWSDRIREWELGGHEVFVYFNNDGDGNAVRNGWRLRELLAA